MDWNDLPVSVNTLVCPETVRVNAGSARSQGFEIESTYQFNESLRLSLGGAYANVELTEDAPELSALSGDRLPNSPDYSANLGLMYDFELGGHASYVRGDYAYVGGFYNQIGEIGEKAGDYGQLNMSAGIALNQFNIELFANNLSNEDALTSVTTLFPDTRAYRLRPRTIGMNVNYQF